MDIDVTWRYIMEQIQVLSQIDKDEVFQLSQAVLHQMDNNRQIIFVGNGGCASIANHFEVDFNKLEDRKGNRPNARSLCANGPILTAHSNDFSFEEVFSYQLENVAYENDLLIAMSGSGSSKNIINAIEKANEMRLLTFGLTGFPAATEMPPLCDNSIIIQTVDWGFAEDAFATILHTVYFYLRCHLGMIKSEDIAGHFMHDDRIGE